MRLPKGYTVILLPPEGHARVRRFRLRSWLVGGVASLLICLGLAAAYFGHDYYRLKKALPDINRLQKENLAQRTEIIGFTERLSEFRAEMEKLSQFNHKLKVVLGLETAGAAGAYQGQGGSDSEASKPKWALEKQLNRQMKAMRRELERLSHEASLSEQTQQELQSFLESRKSVLAATPSIWPARGWITSTFGMRRSPFTGKREFHKGLDIANKYRSPIYAPADGIVARVGREGGYGRIIEINHGYGLKTRYAHLRRALVKSGQLVKRGQQIAQMGNSGRSTGSHLHYEVWLNGKPVNPYNYILD